MKTSPRLLAVGGAHVDRRGRMSGRHIPATSNPGRMREEVGGGAFNAARLAARRGVSVSLLSLRGGDAAAAAVAEAIERAGIEDHSAVFLDRTTPSYTAILDCDGELITGLADMELYEIAFPKQMRRRKCLDLAAASDAILCDANMPQAAIETLVAASTAPVYAIAISPAKARRLATSFSRLSALFMNRREALHLAGLSDSADLVDVVGKLRACALRNGIITAGSKSVIAFSEDGRLAEITPPEIAAVADVTGAGDALAGATLAALMKGCPLFDAVREGVAAAGLTVAQAAVTPGFDEITFAAAMRQVPQARLLSAPG